VHELRDPKRGQGRRLRRFRDDRVAADESRAELVPEQRRRKVPRDDRDDDSQRPLDDEPVRIHVEIRDVRTAQALRQPRVVLDRLAEARDLDARLAQRLALLQRQLERQLVALLEHSVGPGADDLAAFRRRRLPPGRECLARPRDSLGGFARPQLRHASGLFARRGIPDDRDSGLDCGRHHAPLNTG
jgi:hypothetical protein